MFVAVVQRLHRLRDLDQVVSQDSVLVPRLLPRVSYFTHGKICHAVHSVDDVLVLFLQRRDISIA
jgi:hypothetical protein